MTGYETSESPLHANLIAALPQAILAVRATGEVIEANPAAEQLFSMSRQQLMRRDFLTLPGVKAPLAPLFADAVAREAHVSGYGMAFPALRGQGSVKMDVFISPAASPDTFVVMLQERSIAEKMSRQLTHRGAARSLSALAAMLAHEIKNPLSGIRGAAQLLEQVVPDDDRPLTVIIREETDRIVRLVDRFESFSEDRPHEREPLNIHSILNHVKILARNGFARDIRVIEEYDPSLPLVYGNRDQLTQVVLNLAKNAAEAIGPNVNGAEIRFTTAYRPGVRRTGEDGKPGLRLPLEVAVRDNGPGVPDEIRPNLFDPFFTTKQSGTGLGLALVASIIEAHGGLVECDSVPARTEFRILLPTSPEIG